MGKSLDQEGCDISNPPLTTHCARTAFVRRRAKRIFAVILAGAFAGGVLTVNAYAEDVSFLAAYWCVQNGKNGMRIQIVSDDRVRESTVTARGEVETSDFKVQSPQPKVFVLTQPESQTEQTFVVQGGDSMRMTKQVMKGKSFPSNFVMQRCQPSDPRVSMIQDKAPVTLLDSRTSPTDSTRAAPPPEGEPKTAQTALPQSPPDSTAVPCVDNPQSAVQIPVFPVELTDADAKKLLEHGWRTSSASIKLGALNVWADEGMMGPQSSKLSKGVIVAKDFRWYKALEKVGVISIRQDPRWASFRKGRADNEMFLLANNGVRDIVVVEATKTGLALDRTDLPSHACWLVIAFGSGKTTKIIKNEVQKKGAEDYRVIMATYTINWTSELQQAREIIGEPTSMNRKGIFLYKFDPFKSTWVSQAHDAANETDEFKTKNVSTALTK